MSCNFVFNRAIVRQSSLKCLTFKSNHFASSVTKIRHFSNFSRQSTLSINRNNVSNSKYNSNVLCNEKKVLKRFYAEPAQAQIHADENADDDVGK